MNVLFFGTYDEARHPRVRAMREGFRSAGWDVHELNARLADSTADRVNALQTAREGMLWFRRLLVKWRALRRNAKRLATRPQVVVVGYLGVLDVFLARRLFRKSVIVLDHMAPLSETVADRRLGLAARSIAGLLDRVAVWVSDLVVVDTVEHVDAVGARTEKAVVVPVASPESWFRAPPVERQGFLRVVFFGLHTPLQGTPVIGAAIKRLEGAEVDFTMIGTGQDYEECRRLAGSAASVKWIDWVDADDLPDVVADHDVCLGVFGAQAKTQVVVPNKVVQGAAAGCAIVTGDSPPVRRVFGDAAMYVPLGDSGALADALLELASNRSMVLAQRQRAAEVADTRLHPAVAIEMLLVRLEAMSRQEG